MASSVNAVLCALLAAAFWTVLGYSIARHILPRGLAAGAGPVIGWAVFSAATLPILTLIGFTPSAVVVADVLCLLGSLCLLAMRRRQEADAGPGIPLWAFAGAAVLAAGPAAALMPKISATGVQLADPIFDHAKIAIVDAMARQGLPAVNPVFASGRLVYYYLWHFSAAELALALGVTGWEAAIGLTWFTAFASLALTMGIAVWLGKKSGAAILVVLLAAAASLRVTLSWIFGSYELTPFMQQPTGFAGWLFQAAWVPQHLMAASCVVVAMLLIARYAKERSLVLLLTLVLVVVAGFESSTYVGGVTFALAALAATPVLLWKMERDQRLRFVIGLAVAAALVAGLASPFVLDQFGSVAARGDTRPIVVHHFEVLGEMFPLRLRRVLDLPAYWLLLLPIEFPAAYVAGVAALV